MMSFGRIAAKQSLPCSRMRSGKAGIVGLELEVRPVERHQLRHLVQRQHAFQDRRSGRTVASSSSATKLGEIVRHRRLHFQANDAATPAALQRRLVEADQILRLLLDLDVGIPDDPEGAQPLEHL